MSRLNSITSSFLIAAVIVALTIAPILLTDHAAKEQVLQLAKPYNVTPQSIPKTIVMVLLSAKPIVGMVARMMVIVQLIQLTGKVDIEQAGLALVATYRK